MVLLALSKLSGTRGHARRNLRTFTIIFIYDIIAVVTLGLRVVDMAVARSVVITLHRLGPTAMRFLHLQIIF